MSHAAQQREVADLLTFLGVKRDLYVAEVGSVVSEFADERLLDDVFSRDDVAALLAELRASVQARVRRDHDQAAAMAALVAEQLLQGAEAAGCAAALTIDLSRTEDAGALERVRNVSAVLLAPGAAGARGARMDATAGRLESLREEAAR